jgi:hypothetical protein
MSGFAARVLWRRRVQRHIVHGERTKLFDKALQLGVRHARAGTAGVGELAVPVVEAEQQRSELRTRALGVRPSDDDELLAGRTSVSAVSNGPTLVGARAL